MISIEYKTCSACKILKSDDEFFKDIKNSDGHQGLCKNCSSEKAKNWYQHNKERAKKTSKKYRSKHPENIHSYHLKSRYQMDLIDYNKLFEEQFGCCAICGIHQSKLSKRLCVDHNHITNKVRSLLCTDCNLFVDHVEDKSELLTLCKVYLDNWRNK